MASSIQRILSSPASVAHALNWSMNLSRDILAVHIGGKAIDIALLSHPGQNDYPVRSLPPLSLSKQNPEDPKKPQFLEQLSDIVAANRVCGLVVSYDDPGPSESVLDTLNKILQDDNIVASNRPACVWDAQTGSVDSTSARDKGHDGHNNRQHRSFSTQPALENHFSDDASPSDEGMLAAAVASSYLRTHWPDLAPKRVRQTAAKADVFGQEKVLPEGESLCFIRTDPIKQYKEEPDFLGERTEDPVGVTSLRSQADEGGDIDAIRETFVVSFVPKSETTQFAHIAFDRSTTVVDSMLRKQPQLNPESKAGAAQRFVRSVFEENVEIKEELLPQKQLRELVREVL